MNPTFVRGAARTQRRAPQPIILGLRMRPLTLGHLLLLIETESPFTDPARDFKLHDFYVAVFICTQPSRKAERALGSWWLLFFFWVWALWTRRADISGEMRRFSDWFAAETAMPAFKRPDGEGKTRPCGAPGPWTRLLFLIHYCHMTEAEAREVAVIKASALYATWADWEGKAELLDTPQRSTLLEFARDQDAKKFNPDGTRKQPAQEQRN